MIMSPYVNESCVVLVGGKLGVVVFFILPFFSYLCVAFFFFIIIISSYIFILKIIGQAFYLTICPVPCRIVYACFSFHSGFVCGSLQEFPTFTVICMCVCICETLRPDKWSCSLLRSVQIETNELRDEFPLSRCHGNLPCFTGGKKEKCSLFLLPLIVPLRLLLRH